MNCNPWAALRVIAVLATPVSAASAQSVQEVSIATPSVVAVEVRDAPFVAGGIEKLPAPSSEKQGSWIAVGDRWGLVVGPRKDHVRIGDTPPSAYLNREQIDNAAAYGSIGGSVVKAVYRKSMPYDSGLYRGQGGEIMTGASLKHYIYLKLDKPLSKGAHTIKWPGGVLPETSFDYDSHRTRAIAIHANQLGYRASDKGKVAFLSLWLPGGPAEGAVDFRAYGVKKFEIVDSSGHVQFSSPITLRAAPDKAEPGNGLGRPLLDYVNASRKGLPVTKIGAGDPTIATIPGHGFATGQRIWLDGFSGGQSGFNGFATVGATTRDTIEVTELLGGGPTRNTPVPTAFAAHVANRAGTYVFELNFSAWTQAKPGTYRLHIPHLGVSDPFEVRDDIWLQAGRTSIGGLYNHRSGIALDGRFGFTRPESFRPSQEFPVQLSRLPLSWSTGTDTGIVGQESALKAPWNTGEPAPDDYWGGYMDAGDWDRRIQHLDVTYLLLDVFESSPRATAAPLNIPKSSELLDASLYAEIDDLPDIVHEAVWALDFYRRLQLPDGSVRGGIESESHPLFGEPSFLEHFGVYAFAPDPISTYRYAAVAAKFARLLDQLGKKKLAQVYRESALRAWSSAETAGRDPTAHYEREGSVALDAKAFDKAAWSTMAEKLAAATTEFRVAAAASLFRYTGEDQYRSIFEETWPKTGSLYLHNGDGAWEYFRATAPAANKDLQKRIADKISAEAAAVAKSQDGSTYPNMKHPYAPFGWGQGLAPDYNQTMMFIRAHQITSDGDLLRTMYNASAHILGANQVGLSFTTGLGLRTIRHPLHEDHRAMGVPAPHGITIYGWASPFTTAHDWIFNDYWSPLPLFGTREHAAQRRVTPDPFSMPLYEYMIEHPLLVAQQEYTVQQTIATTAAMWLYLHAAGQPAR